MHAPGDVALVEDTAELGGEASSHAGMVYALADVSVEVAVRALALAVRPVHINPDRSRAWLHDGVHGYRCRRIVHIVPHRHQSSAKGTQTGGEPQRRRAAPRCPAGQGRSHGPQQIAEDEVV